MSLTMLEFPANIPVCNEGTAENLLLPPQQRC